MGFIQIDGELALQSVPEDIKRYIFRETEKFKSSSFSINYRFAQYIVTRYEALKKIFMASESTETETEELQRAYAFYTNVVQDNRNQIAICKSCKKIMGVFKNTFPGVSLGEFVRHLLAVTATDSCPHCGMKGCATAGTEFLITYGTLEGAFGEPLPKRDEKDAAVELVMITAVKIGFCEDLKSTIKVLNSTFGDNALKNFIINGRTQRLVIKQDDGTQYDLLGKIPIEILRAQKPETLKTTSNRDKSVPQNDADKIKHYRLLAGQGDADSQSNLGSMYFHGQGVRQDYVEAMKWYRKAADQGYAVAQLLLGQMYSNGQGVPQDYVEAVKWYRKAADQRFAVAQLMLGDMYGFGQGVPQSDAEAVKWYRLAAEQELSLAQYNLACMLKNGKGVTQNHVEAARWCQKAAEKGIMDAQSLLATMFLRGLGVLQSDREAAKWFRKAADQGCATAQNSLGWMYTNGKGIPQDYVEGVKWYKKGADQGLVEAQFNLGLMYEKGFGVSQDKREAIKWYRLAAENGDSDAKEALERISRLK